VKGGLITSQPSRFCEMLVGNIATTGHHARVVALGGIAQRKGVSSRANLLISVKCLWVMLSPISRDN
jgi:hypothetical protein